VEPAPGRRLRAPGRLLRQHGTPLRDHVAFIENPKKKRLTGDVPSQRGRASARRRAAADMRSRRPASFTRRLRASESASTSRGGTSRAASLPTSSGTGPVSQAMGFEGAVRGPSGAHRRSPAAVRVLEAAVEDEVHAVGGDGGADEDEGVRQVADAQVAPTLLVVVFLHLLLNPTMSCDDPLLPLRRTAAAGRF
jgi:hypothetical protein